MKNLLSSFLLLFLSVGHLHAQVDQSSDQCSTPDLDSLTAMALPYYGNNQVIENYLVQNGYNNLPYISFPSIPQAHTDPFIEPNFLIPLNIYVYRDASNAPSSSVTENDARDFICRVNEIYRNAGTAIQFYTNRIEFEANSNYNSQISSSLGVYEMWARKRFWTDPSKGINIHFIRYNNAPEDKPGKASLPQYNVPYSAYSLYVRTHEIPSGSMRDVANIAATLAHEIGHSLGLLHTHHPGRFASYLFNSGDGQGNGTVSNGCYQESVSRVKKNYWYNGCFGTDNKLKCEINGDFLRDTSGDPNQEYRVSSSGCIYNAPASGNFRQDNWGDLWIPPTRNVMSYSAASCRKEFTRHQTGVMWMQMTDLKQFLNYQTPQVTSITFHVGMRRIIC